MLLSNHTIAIGCGLSIFGGFLALILALPPSDAGFKRCFRS